MFRNKSFKLLLAGGYSITLLLAYLLGLLFKFAYLFYPVLFAGPGFFFIESLGGYTIGGGSGDSSGNNYSYSYWVVPLLDSVKLPAYLPFVLMIVLNVLSWFILGAIIDRILKPSKVETLSEIQK